MTFKDHFSKQAESYADYRPSYPAELFEFIFSQCAHHELAWDCACGTGQASQGLSKGFSRVIASDASAAQLKKAQAVDNIHYQCFPAEKSPFEDHSLDLITVAQALHWFDFDEFFKECKRVLKPSAPLVVWTYGLTKIDETIDRLNYELYEHVLGAYWPPERKHIEQAYSNIEFPFRQLEKENDITMQQQWNRKAFMGYLRTWSSTQAYIDQHGINPLVAFEEKLSEYWNDTEIKTVQWPLYVVVCRD